jgi:hypothetical protein
MGMQLAGRSAWEIPWQSGTHTQIHTPRAQLHSYTINDAHPQGGHHNHQKKPKHTHTRNSGKNDRLADPKETPDTHAMQLLYTINDAHPKAVTAIACTSDSTKIISGGEEGQVRLLPVAFGYFGYSRLLPANMHGLFS